jgi:hypothetical protein
MESPGSTQRSSRGIRMPCPQDILALVEALALGKPHRNLGGLMASLDPYHLGQASLGRCAPSHRGRERLSSSLRNRCMTSQRRAASIGSLP